MSIILPTYNRAHRLEAAIDSIQQQTFQDFEIIIVDDASTDGTIALVNTIDDPRIRLIRHPVNRGAAASRNTGISEATGRYIALLDSDDIWHPEKLQRQLDWLRQQRGGIRAVCTGFNLVLPGNNPVARVSDPELTLSKLYLGCRCAPGSTLMVETSVFQQAGMFDEALRRLEDWDWLLRCARITKIGVIQDILAVVTIEPRGRGLYPIVKQAAARMEQSWCHDPSNRLPAADRFALTGTLRNELAAVAYSERKFPQAIWHILFSLLYLPRRSRDFFVRIGYRVYCDTSFAIRRMFMRLAGHGERRRRRAMTKGHRPAAENGTTPGPAE